MSASHTFGVQAPYEVVTVAYKSRSLLSRFLARFPARVRVIVVDNSAAEENITDIVKLRPTTTYLDSGGNVGFGAACNLAAQVAEQPLLVFLNVDTDVNIEVLDALAEQVLGDARCSSSGPLLVNAEGRVRGSGGWLPTPGRAFMHATGLFQLWPSRGITIGPATGVSVDVEWIAGTCLMLRRDVFVQTGGFAPRYFLYQEDMDLGRRLHERGYRQTLRVDLRVRHDAGRSSTHQDVRVLAWLRASALVDYLFATLPRTTARLTCAILACGHALRIGRDLLRGHTARLAEFWTHLLAFTLPGRTLRAVQAQRRLRLDACPPAPIELKPSAQGRY